MPNIGQLALIGGGAGLAAGTMLGLASSRDVEPAKREGLTKREAALSVALTPLVAGAAAMVIPVGIAAVAFLTHTAVPWNGRPVMMASAATAGAFTLGLSMASGFRD